MSTISDTHRSITITDVRDILVTTTVEADGSFRRAIRILGTPPEEDDQPVEIIELVLVASDRDFLNVDAPAQIF